MEGMTVDFGYASAQIGANEEFEAFELGLKDDETKIGFGVCVARLIFYEFYLECFLSADLLSFKGQIEKNDLFARAFTCLRILSSIRSINAWGQGKTSGAHLSITQTRVSSCKSRVS